MCEDTIELGAITLPPAELNKLAQRSTKTDIINQSSRLPFGQLMSAYLCLAAIYFI